MSKFIIKNVSAEGAQTLIVKQGKDLHTIRPGGRFHADLSGGALTIEEKGQEYVAVDPGAPGSERTHVKIGDYDFDLETADKDMLVAVLKSVGEKAQRNWRLETLRGKIADFLQKKNR